MRLLLLLLLLPTLASAGPALELIAPELRPGERSQLRLHVSPPEGSWFTALEWSFGDAPAGLSVGPVEVPAGSGEPPAWWSRATLLAPLTPSPELPQGALSLSSTLRWTLCDAKGCQPPSRTAIEVPLTVLGPLK